MFSQSSRFSLLLSLAACCALISCAHAQDDPADVPDKPEPKTVKPAANVAKRAQPKTFVVKAGGAKGGDGSAPKPFASIQEAIDGAQGGDTIVVGAGTYEGGISITAAYPDDAPLTIRAADGAQPVISGMKPVTGWKAGANGVYTTEIEGKAENLFVGAERLSLASWPKIDDDWIKVTALDPAGKMAAFTSQAPPKTTKDTQIYAYAPTRKNYEFRAFTNLNVEGTNGKLTFDDAGFKPIQSGKVSKFTFFNAPSFITEGDEYALEYPDGKTRFSFKPRDIAELATTQFRAGSSGITFEPRSANVHVSGFVVTGMNDSGIGSAKASKITVENCVMYNNGTGFGSGNVSDLTLRRCLIAQNYWGVGIFGANKVAMEQCEIAFNDEDGLRVSGRVFDKASQKLGATDLKFSQVYIHHHQYQGHPDNVQFFRGVGRVEFDRCLLMYGGQQMMMEQTEDMNLHDSVVLIGINRGLNLYGYGRPDAKGWTVTGNTVGLLRYNPIYVGGTNNSSQGNVVFGYAQPVTFPSGQVQADYDWFSPQKGVRPFSLEKRKGAAPTAAQVETKSQSGDPKLRNVPASMTVTFGGSGTTAEHLVFDTDATALFAVGDLIEINGDGVQRKVTAVDEKSISFAPALPAAPFRYSNVINWKNNPNSQIDTRPAPGSPVLTAGPDGKAAGSSLDVPAYQKGDFDSDGKRDLPVVPKELAAMLGNRPNRYIYPYSF